MIGRSKNVGELNGRFIPRGDGGAKRCSACHTLQPITAFKVDQSRFDGRGYICAGCRDEARTAPGPTIRERRVKGAAGLKWCGACESWKAADGVHAGYCKPCKNAADRRRYADDPAFRLRRQGRGAARRRGVEPVPAEGKLSILDQFEGRCAYCPAKATTWDHVVAVTKGGSTEPYNMVPACGPCNSSKRTQNLWTWLEKTGRTPHPQLIERLSLYDAGLIPGFGPDPFD